MASIPACSELMSSGGENTCNGTRKRKQVSPVKPGQDYSSLLRKKEVSASPIFKRARGILVNKKQSNNCAVEQNDSNTAAVGENCSGESSGTVEEEDEDPEITFS